MGMIDRFYIALSKGVCLYLYFLVLSIINTYTECCGSNMLDKTAQIATGHILSFVFCHFLKSLFYHLIKKNQKKIAYCFFTIC